MDKPTRFFINTDQLPGEVTGKLVAMGKQLLTRFGILKEAGFPNDVWTQRTNDGIIFKLDKSGDIDNVKIFMPIKGQKGKERLREVVIERLIVGMEYTDGLIWRGNYFDDRYYPNDIGYRGFGIVFGTIDDEFNPTDYIKWDESADLKFPYDLVYSTDNGSYFFQYAMQGEIDKTYYKRDDKEKKELIPLKEAECDANYKFDNLFNQDIQIVCTCGYIQPDGTPGHNIPQDTSGMDYAIEVHCNSFWQKMSSGLFFEDKIIEPLSVVTTTFTADTHLEYPGYIDAHTFQKYVYQYDGNVTAIGGLAVDGNLFAALYVRTYSDDYTKNVLYQEDQHTVDRTEYTGTVRYQIVLNASGVEYIIKEGIFINEYFVTPTILCVRIFKDSDDAEPIYVFSFIEYPHTDPPTVDYGYVYKEKVYCTTKGYQQLGYNYDDGEGWTGIYYTNANIIPGVPETDNNKVPTNYYSSGLLRMFKERITKEEKI
jgi:hypothetical protein